MGLTSLESMDDLIAINRENYLRYTAALNDLPGINVLDYTSNDKRNYHYVVVQVDPSQSPLKRDDLVDVLHAENVLARKYFWPGCHRMHPYDKLFPNAHLLLQNTDAIAARVMVLPTGQTISAPEISAICRIIRSALAQSDAVKQAVNTNRRATAVNASATTLIP